MVTYLCGTLTTNPSFLSKFITVINGLAVGAFLYVVIIGSIMGFVLDPVDPADLLQNFYNPVILVSSAFLLLSVVIFPFVIPLWKSKINRILSWCTTGGFLIWMSLFLF